MARRPAPTSLDEAVSFDLKPPADQGSPEPPPARRPPAGRSLSREGKRGVAFWLKPDAFHAVRLLSVQTDRPVQSLMEEATDLLFRAHGVHPIARDEKPAR
jgi:hypothetical protein